MVLNHSQRSEAILIPGLFFFLRDGKRVHFMADWNFCLFPPVAILYRCAQVITLARIVCLPHRVIAEVMDRSEEAVRQLLARAVLRLTLELRTRGVELSA